jgi:hypothetical protein
LAPDSPAPRSACSSTICTSASSPPHRPADPRTHPRAKPRLSACGLPPCPPGRAPLRGPPLRSSARSRGQGWPQATRRAQALTAARTMPPSVNPGTATPR